MKRLALLCLLVSATPAAWGQYFETWFSGGQAFMSNAGMGTTSLIGGSNNDVEITDGFQFAIRIGFNGDSLLGYEILYAHTSPKLRYNQATPPLEQGMGIHDYGADVLLHANHEGNRFRPFLAGGVQVSNYVPPGGNAFYSGSTKFGVNYGGGLKVRVVGPWALRVDLRQYTTPKPFNFPLREGWIRRNEASVGLGFVF